MKKNKCYLAVIGLCFVAMSEQATIARPYTEGLKPRPLLELQSKAYKESLTFWGGIKYKLINNIDILTLGLVILIIFGYYLDCKARAKSQRDDK